MKTPSDELFTLIRSLSSQEKRHFKLFYQGKSDNTSFLLLFDSINALERYDENELKAILHKQGGIKNLKRIKSYLQESVLGFLEHHYSDYSVDIELQRLLQRVEILKAKRLFKPAKKILVKAERLAEKSFSYNYLSVIYSMRNEMIASEINLEEVKKNKNELYRKEIHCAEVLKNLIEYNKLAMQVRSIMISKGHFKTGKEKEIRSLLKNPLLHNESNAISFPARIRFHSMRSDLFIFRNEWQKSFNESEKFIRLMEENPSYLKTKIDFYLIRINNIVGLMSQLKKEKELNFYMHKVRHFVESLPKKLQTGNIFRTYIEINTNYIDYLLSASQFSRAAALSKELSGSVKKYFNAPHFIIFHFNFCLACFYSEDLHGALREMNLILSLDEEGVLQDIINAAKLLNILIHYELRHEEMLPNLCRSTQRYLEKKGELKYAEKLLLSFFGKESLYEKSGKEKIRLFGELRTELEKHKSEKMFTLFDLIAYVDSKIKGK